MVKLDFIKIKNIYTSDNHILQTETIGKMKENIWIRSDKVLVSRIQRTLTTQGLKDKKREGNN